MNEQLLLRIWCALAIFGSGIVTANNLTILIGYDQSYEGAWWKIFAAIAFAIFCFYKMTKTANPKRRGLDDG